MKPDEVIHFWFTECTPAQWYAKDVAFDAKMRERFAGTHAAVSRGETAAWRDTPEGRLAEILVLDQFSRNMFRGTPQMYASDALAVRLAHDAIAAGADRQVPKRMRHFFYMPLMHSEIWRDHVRALWLFLRSLDWGGLRYEIDHARVIWKFGRYPSRNAILGRVSTPDEIKFLKTHTGW